MLFLQDRWGRLIRLTEERLGHLESTHPEMRGQSLLLAQTLLEPDLVVRSKTDSQVELFYHLYPSTPVTTKFMCVAVKVLPADRFIITAYFTDAMKQGEMIWEKK